MHSIHCYFGQKYNKGTILPSLLLILSFHCVRCQVHDEAVDGDMIGNNDTIGYAGMVASAHYLASEAGAKILKAGGTAADAAVAVQLVLNVVQPSSSGIGGGAFIVYYDSETKQTYALDGREEAPEAYNPYVFCSNITCFNTNGASGDCDDCDTITFLERKVGGLAIGVPGTLYAYKKLWDIFGNTEWSDLFEDAIDIATDGFIMYEGLYNYIAKTMGDTSRFESSCEALLNYPYCNASKFEVNDTTTFPDLAETFKTLSSNADDAITNFYEGTIAQAIVDEAQNAVNPITGRGGLITMSDMAGYQAVFREPMSTTFTQNEKEYQVVGMNMPTSGSLTIQYQLKMLEYLQTEDDFSSFDATTFNDYHSVESLHYLFSAQNIAFADRDQYMADQDFVNVPIEGLQDESYLKQRAIDYLSAMAQSLPIAYGEPDGWDQEAQSETRESGTSHMCIVDQWGNVASITTTIEWAFGSGVVVDGYGIFLNNELTDFGSVGVVDGEIVANGPEGGKELRSSAIDVLGYTDSATYGGKRPRSSMAPTIVLYDGVPYLATGAPGGSSIIGTTFGVVARSLIYGIGVQESVNAPRIWGRNGGNLEFEISWWQEKNSVILDELVNEKNYNETFIKEKSWGHVSAIQMDPDSKMIYCGADWNRWPTARCVAVCNDDADSQCPFDEASDDKKSNTGLIVGIVIAVIIGVIVIVVVVFLVIPHNKPQEEVAQNDEETQPVTETVEMQQTHNISD